MTDFFWPSTLIPARSSITLRDLSSRFVSPFTGTSRTYSRPGGDLLQMRMDLPPLTAAKGAALRGIVSKLRGGVHRVWCKDHSYVRRGSFPATELMYSGDFSAGTTGWTVYDANSTITAADGVLRVTAAASAQYIGAYESNRATATGATYAARAMFIPGTVSESAASTVQILGVTSASTAGYGMRTVSGAAAGTSTQVEIYSSLVSNHAAGAYFDLAYASFARCALVKGASQTGARILIDALPTSTNGLLLEGDQVQIGEELFIVAAPLNSNGSGEGYLTLHRPVRSSPADNAPVIIHEPMGLFMLAENENGWENVPGRITNASVSLIEAVR